MKNNMSRNLMEVYGLARLALGVAQLTGLFFAYFLTEFVLHYPQWVGMNLLSEDMTVVLFIVVFLRGFFHVISGIGLTLAQKWVAAFFFFIWPLMILTTFIVGGSLARFWLEEGAIGSFSGAFSGVSFLIYLLWAAFDCFYVPRLIESSQDIKIIKSNKQNWAKIGGIIGITCLVMGVALLQNKETARGFYKGYYKGRGKLKVEKVLRPPQQKVQSAVNISQTPPKVAPSEQPSEKPLVEEEAQVFYPEQVSPQATGPQRIVSPDSPKKTIKGGRLELSLEIIGGLFIILGLVLQIGCLMQVPQNISLSYFGFLLLSGGFASWMGYGFMKQMSAFGIICLVGAILSMVLTGLLIKHSK